MSFIVVLGNSYEIKPELKQKLGFTFSWDHKVWYRACLQDKFEYYRMHVEALSKQVEACWVNTLEDIPKLRQAIKEEIGEEQKRKSLESHEHDGQIFEVSKWYAQRFKENNNTQYTFRNLEILKVHSETPRAYLVDAKFFSGIASSCGVCGRGLDNDTSRATGIGPICASKLGLPRPTMETAKLVVAELEKLSEAQGVFHQVWVPKSQIKSIVSKTSKQGAA